MTCLFRIFCHLTQDEQITQLTDFVKSVMEYHQKSYDILETLVSSLEDK